LCPSNLNIRSRFMWSAAEAPFCSTSKPWWLDADTAKIKKTFISYTSCFAVSNVMANLRNLMLYVFKHKDKSISLCSIQCALRVHVVVVDSNDLFSLEQKHICD
jgi:hypothetical protein